MISRKYTEVVVVPLTAISLAFLAGALFILAIGKNPIDVYGVMLQGTLGTSYGIGQVLFKSTPLILTGLSVALAFHAGLFNIGAEGQLNMGALAMGLMGWWITATWPSLSWIIVIPLCLIAGFMGGAVWGFIPGWLKARFGVHEVINTIMLNFISLGIVNYLVMEHFHIPETIHTPEIGPAAHIPRFDALIPLFSGSPVNASLLIALGIIVLSGYLLFRTRLGYEIRALGFNPPAAEYAGININRITWVSMALSGGIAGMVGMNFILGYKYYFEDGFAGGVGFMGIAVALLGKNHPIGIVLAALLFGILSQGGLAINTQVPKDLVEILEAIIILLMVVMTEIFRRRFSHQKQIK